MSCPFVFEDKELPKNKWPVGAIFQINNDSIEVLTIMWKITVLYNTSAFP